MKIPKQFGTIRRRLEKKAAAREAIFRSARDVRQASKRAIFAFHRGDEEQAQTLLAEADKALKKAEKPLVACPEFIHAGMYREGLEEYIEARMYEFFLQKRRLMPLQEGWGDEAYLSGLSDTTGEVVRWAVARATEKEVGAVEEAAEFIELAVELFLSLDLSGYVRNKADQAKKNLRTIEQMRYDLSLRQ